MTNNGGAVENGGATPARSKLLDVLVVGGGPGGTAAAFRATELGLKALVIDYDDRMKRIRDYPKDKLILPGFGGGDKMKFPQGGEMIAALRFAAIDKDEMCSQWKAFYSRFEVPYRDGVELTGLEEADNGAYRVLAWDHRARSDRTFLAKTLVIAIGRGVPRRFDIPGNTDGIAYRLSDAGLYVGQPACVVGGGTSAAEAVIAISNAKADGNDPSAVYWSYRGDKMPRVSKALAEEFFEAYVGNGNIRYYPKSDPAAIVMTEDRAECLAIRVDRRRIEGRPSESSHLEFSKECCVACIGEDLPELLLNSMGIYMVTGGPKNKKRMVVNRYLETRRDNVFMVGDLLSQAYFETDDFDADPTGFREVKHRGNIKSALRSGVLVAEVIRQRLDGKTEIEVDVGDAEDLSGPEVKIAVAATPVESEGPPVASIEPERSTSEGQAILIRVLPTGVEENEYPVARDGVTTIGRQNCDLSFPNDSMLSTQHASISHTDEGYFLRDDGSQTGSFLRVQPARKMGLQPGDLIRAGRQFLLVAHDAGAYSVRHFDHTGHELGRHEVGAKAVVLGRQAPDVILDAGDGTLSRRHLAMSTEGDELWVKDLKSVNGTFLRVRSARRLEHGDRIRLGQQIFLFSLRAEEPLDEGHVATSSEPVAASTARQPMVEAAASAAGSVPAVEGAAVTFKGSGKTAVAAAGQTICEIAEQNGIEIVAECHAGICGSDPVRIVSGLDNVAAPAGEQEVETLEEICELEPGECRLACMLKIKGPVELDIL